jgi:hypothetical protein
LRRCKPKGNDASYEAIESERSRFGIYSCGSRRLPWQKKSPAIAGGAKFVERGDARRCRRAHSSDRSLPPHARRRCPVRSTVLARAAKRLEDEPIGQLLAEYANDGRPILIGMPDHHGLAVPNLRSGSPMIVSPRSYCGAMSTTHQPNLLKPRHMAAHRFQQIAHLVQQFKRSS